MADAMQELIATLALERLEHNLFRGSSPKVGWQRIFGGQVIAQAVVAGHRTVEPEYRIHSLHGYFMRPGDPAVPIIFEVDRIRDGRSFVTRRVNAIQHGHAIFTLIASFQIEEEGLAHQDATMAEVTPPEELMTDRKLVEDLLKNLPAPMRAWWERERPIDIRPVTIDHYISDRKLPAVQHVWIRTRTPIEQDDPVLKAAILAYASDMTLLDAATYPHGRSVWDPELQVASLDHAMWFHRPGDLSDWMLYSSDSPVSGGSRGFSRGKLFDREGTLIASTAQEGLMRLRHKGE